MDYPYIINYLILIIMAYSYWHKPNNKIVVWAFVLEFVFIAFRAPVVGADTWNYVRYLDGERNFYNYDSRALENGFIIYKDVMHFLKCDRFFVMLLNSIITIAPVFILIRRYSYNVPLTLAVIPFFGFYSVYFVGLRQILGITFLLVSIYYILENAKYKWLLYIIASVLGYQFHTSIAIYSLIFFVSYFVRFSNRKVAITIILSSAIIGIIIGTLSISELFN